MFGNSRRVTSDQTDISPRLPINLRNGYRKPFAAGAQQTFAALDRHRLRHAGPVCLDAGCGTGESTVMLAQRHPEALVVGIDRSAHRLARRGIGSGPVFFEGNAVWVQMDVVDFWRLAAGAGWRCSHHYFLYPNPWPKHKHLKKRWYAHPTFASVLALSGQLEVRSNWEIYIREFAHCVAQRCDSTPVIDTLRVEQPLSPFEAKYAASQHRLLRLQVRLP